jgi:hypothetical protein
MQHFVKTIPRSISSSVMFETIMHLAMLSFVAILAATVAGMPQAASQTTLFAAPTPTASGSTSSIQTYPLCAVSMIVYLMRSLS